MTPKPGTLKLQVVAPCTEDWNDMPGGDDIRFCGRCRQNVYNLSEMTESQARELVQGPVCVRFFARGDGTVITRRCSPMLEAARRRMVALGAGLLPLAAGFWGTVAWLRDMVHAGRPAVQGGISAPPRPTMGEPVAAPQPPRPPEKDSIPIPPRPPRRHHLMGKRSPAVMGEWLIKK